MTDAEAILDHGQIGDTCYDADTKKWRGARVFGQGTTLQPAGSSKVHVGPSVNNDDGEDEPQYRLNVTSHLFSAYPQLLSAKDAVCDVSGDARKGILDHSHEGVVAFGIIRRSERGHPAVPIVAFAAGTIGERLYVIRGKPGREGWVRDFATTLATTHYDEKDACIWEDAKGQIFGIYMSRSPKHGWLLLAIRYAKSLTVLKVSLGRESDQAFAPKHAVSFDLVADFRHFQPELRDVKDISFDPQDVWHFASAHASGYVHFWRLPRNRRWAVSVDDIVHISGARYSSQLSASDTFEVQRVLKLPKQYILAVTKYSVLLSKDPRRDNEYETDSPAQEFTSPILDIKQYPGRNTSFIIVTSHHIMWMAVTWPGENGEPSLNILQAWKHHRDAHDTSLKVCLVSSSDGEHEEESRSVGLSSAFLYSHKNQLITKYDYTIQPSTDDNVPPNIQVSDPLSVSVEPTLNASKNDVSSQFIHLEIFPAPFTTWLSHSSQQGPGLTYKQKGIQFFQAFFLFKDQSLASSIYFGGSTSKSQTQLEGLSWSRTLGPRTLLSGPVADPGFVVDSSWDIDEVRDDVKPGTNWWENPRRIQLAQEATAKKSQLENLQAVHDKTTTIQRQAPMALASDLASLMHLQSEGNLDFGGHTQLLSSLLGLSFNHIPDDIFRASERFEDLMHVSEPPAGASGRSTITEVPYIDLNNTVPLSVAKYSSTSISSLYTQTLESHLATLPSTVPLQTRAVLEKQARQLAAATALSSRLLRPSQQRTSEQWQPLGQHSDPSSSQLQPPLSSQPISGHVASQQIYPSLPGQSQDTQHTEPTPPSHASHPLPKLESLTKVTQNTSAPPDYLTPTPTRILATWSPDNTASQPTAPSQIDLSPYDATRQAPRTEAQLAESQKQMRKMERERLRREAALRSQSLGDPSSSQASLPSSSQTLLPSSSSVPMVGPQSSQTTAPSLGLSQDVVLGSQGVPGQIPGAAKRSSRAVSGSQGSLGLPVRKKRKAGF